MSNIKSIVGGILAAGLSLLPQSCYRTEVYNERYDRKNLLTEVMTDRPQSELDAINKTLHADAALQAVELQRKVDSVAFQDMFQGTQLAKDSEFVNAYNEMMAKTKVPLINKEGSVWYDYEKMENTLHEMVTVGEMKKISKDPIMRGHGKIFTDTGMQYMIDSVAHHKLFEKFGLLDSAGLQKFQKICSKIKP